VRGDGTRLWFLVHASPLLEGGSPRGAIAVGVDITARKLAEDGLKRSEERFRSLVSVITDVPWTTDARGAFVTMQEAWSQYTGQSWEQMRGFGWADALHPEDRGNIETLWQAALRSGSLYGSSGRIWHAPTQAYRFFEARATPILHTDGAVREWVGSCTDIHERKVAEEALREADRRKDEFLATLAHELRNPLAPVRNGLQILRLAGADPSAHAQVLDMMERQVRHMVRLVDDLLEVSRITRGKIELRKNIVELAAVIRNAVETTASLIESAGHRLTIEMPAEPLLLEADAVRVAQVLANLLNNATKYTEEGGEIRLGARRDGDHAILSVRDSGAGIPSEMLPRVFDMFTQIDRTLGRAQGGLGIGLALVRSLVEMHGGRVEARSEGPGRGSEFIVSLPLAGAAARVAWVGKDDAERLAGALKGRRILVVDDNRDAADSLAMLLGFLGAEARTAHDGPSALERVRMDRPSIVFLDLGMPGMDGCAVAAQIRREPQFQEVTLIALTGWGQEEDRRRSREAGFDHHITKPLGIAEVEQILSTIVPAR